MGQNVGLVGAGYLEAGLGLLTGADPVKWVDNRGGSRIFEKGRGVWVTDKY